ncbi:MAG: serine hydrolase domain-containing protein [Bacteroidia bacterium]
MRLIKRYLCILLLLFLPILSFGQTNYPDLLAKYMQAQVVTNDFSGAVLVMKGTEPLLKKAYGLANKEWNVANTIDTKFRIGSVTKQFTAISILLLAEQGKLSLYDKLSKYFPGFPNGDSITIHLMLAHRSGIADYAENDQKFDTLDKFSYSKEFMISYIKKLAPDFKPNVSYHYSNSNYYLLGCIIEKVSGMTYHDFVQANILLPSHMDNTAVESNEDIIEKKAKGYQRTDKGFKNESYYTMELLFSAGAMYSTVDDLYKLDENLRAGKILSKGSIQKMYTSYTYYDTHYGYGAVIDTFQNHKRIWHSGGGWAFNSNITRFPDDNISIIVLSNDQSNSEGIANSLAAILFDVDIVLPYHHKKAIIDSTNLYNFIGTWFGEMNNNPSQMSIYIKDNRLYRSAENVDDVELIPESETKFYYADGSDRQMEFVLNKKGAVESAWFIKDGIKYKRKRIYIYPPKHKHNRC